MTNQEFPFFAGQHTREKFSSRYVLSPLPVKTQIPAANCCNLLMRKTDHYIDLGSEAGSIFQTQYCYFGFMFSLSITLAMLAFWGGYDEVVKSFYELQYLGNDEWEHVFSWYNCIQVLLIFLLPFLTVVGICINIMIQGNRDSARTLPLRFHRQRREVMFSRWNSRTKKPDIKVVPWEKVCAMVGHGEAYSTSGMYSLSSLLIGANDEDDPGHFWAALEVGAMHNMAGVAQWEMIRKFMDEGAEAIEDPRPINFKGLVEEYCQQHEITPDKMSPWIRLWWEINGTRLGIWATNYRLQRSQYTYTTVPEIEDWSQPLPESQWAKPSDELNYYNRMLDEHDYRLGRNILAVSDLRERFGPYPPKGNNQSPDQEPCIGAGH
ncbi:hypothetical protein [Photobacterium sp. J15]|uniref:hypothetical protein n=1 Tax=Photobacterium sp. J15 TaxID=265901 RepID=UPI0007E34205|nr:hypothetical protein [Photobacterium sp. J15]